MKRFTLATALLLVAALSVGAWLIPAATAEIAASAGYFGNDDQGVVTIQAAPGTQCQVYGEQPNGAFVRLANGMVGNGGSVSFGAVPNGVLGNGVPMFMVRVSNADGEAFWLSIPTSESDDHLWGWL